MGEAQLQEQLRQKKAWETQLQKAEAKQKLMRSLRSRLCLADDCTHVQTDQGNCKRLGCESNKLISCRNPDLVGSYRERGRAEQKIQKVQDELETNIAYY